MGGRKLKMSRGGVSRILVAGGVGALVAAGIAYAGEASADPAGCTTDLWGFLGSQRRTICDGPILPDGSWSRGRLFWIPAHQVPLRTSCSGTYYVSCTSTGGYFQPYTEIGLETYWVTPDTVLPDEPGHLL